MWAVYEEGIAEESFQTPFIAVQADETTDVACVSQCVIVLRYITEEISTVERFLFRPISGQNCWGTRKTPDGKAGKQTHCRHDGAAVMSGASAGLQARLKETFPYCYSHQLNLIMQQACSSLKPVRVFFWQTCQHLQWGFFNSPKRTAVLDEVCGKMIPASEQTRWNFKSCTVHTVFEHQNTLKQCFEKIRIDMLSADREQTSGHFF